jgi:hypothetical protein
MENNVNETNVSRWVDDRLAGLAAPSAWEPHADRALERLRERDSSAKRRRRASIWVSLSASAAVLMLLTLPSTRGIAQRLWDRLFQTSVDVVRVNNLEEKPPNFISPPREPQPVADAAEAAARVGFAIRLPSTAALEATALRPTPELAVSDRSIALITIQVAELRAKLQRAGVSPADVVVPQEWDGVVIRSEAGPVAIARYVNGDVLFLQSLPNELIVPAGFSLDQFVEVLFRAGGLTAAEARNRRNRFAANAALLMFIPSDFNADTREVSLPSGHGILIQNRGNQSGRCNFCPAPGELMLVWSSPDRMYGLKGPLLPDQALALANSIN